MDPMHRVETITHKGKSIIVVDLASIKPEEVPAVLREAKTRIAVLPVHSALILTDTTGAYFDKETTGALKDYASHNTPFVKASAVVGADGLRAILLDGIRLLTGREIKSFKNREEALDWLAGHE